MSEKLLAGIVAVTVVAPLCAVCVLGPAVIASVFMGIAAWFGDFDSIVTASLVLVVGVAVFAVLRIRKRALLKPAEEMSQ